MIGGGETVEMVQVGPCLQDANRVALAAFPDVERYHQSLIRAASAGRGVFHSLAGRHVHVSPLLRSENQRERCAASAALLGQACRAAADDVSGMLLAKLSAKLARRAEAGLKVEASQIAGGPVTNTNAQHSVSVVAHGRCELLLRVGSLCAWGHMRAAIDETVNEVQNAWQLSVPIHAVVEKYDVHNEHYDVRLK